MLAVRGEGVFQKKEQPHQSSTFRRNMIIKWVLLEMATKMRDI